ncbi:unnamed protein product, partial [Cylicostephanus goldi]
STGGSFRLNRTQSTNRSLNEGKTTPTQSTPQASTTSHLSHACMLTTLTPSKLHFSFSKVKPRRTVVTITPNTELTEPNGGDTIQEASKREGVPLAV